MFGASKPFNSSRVSFGKYWGGGGPQLGMQVLGGTQLGMQVLGDHNWGCKLSTRVSSSCSHITRFGDLGSFPGEKLALPGGI